MQRVSRLCLSSGVGFQKVSTVPVFLSLMKISLSCEGKAINQNTTSTLCLASRVTAPCALRTPQGLIIQTAISRMSYPVSFQCGQHLLPQLDLSRDLVDTVAAAQEWLQDRREREREPGEGRSSRKGGKTRKGIGKGKEEGRTDSPTDTVYKLQLKISVVLLHSCVSVLYCLA